MIRTIYPSADAVATSEDAGRAGLLQAGYRVITGPGRDWLGLFQRAQVSGKVPGRAVRVGVICAQHPAAPAQDVLIQFPGRLVIGQRALREYFPAALQAFGDLAAPDTLELLARAPDPASAARLATGQITGGRRSGRPGGHRAPHVPMLLW